MPRKNEQKCTHQVPCGEHSLINEAKKLGIPMFYLIVYLVLNYRSKWDTGASHGLSFRDIAKLTGVYRKNDKGKWTGKSRVANAIKWLCDNGWLVKNVRGKGKPNTYQIIHHNCALEDVPLDDDGRPKKCATPRGEGSAFEKMFEGKISWKACLYHTVAKIVSDWTSGVVQFTIKESQKWLRFSNKTICEIRKSLLENNLLEQLSNRFRGFIAKIIPAPYEKRRTRRRPDVKMARRDKEGWYYSFNELWRVSAETGDIQKKIDAKWVYSNEGELLRINKKIHKDFMPVVELAASDMIKRLRGTLAAT